MSLDYPVSVLFTICEFTVSIHDFLTSLADEGCREEHLCRCRYELKMTHEQARFHLCGACEFSPWFPQVSGEV